MKRKCFLTDSVVDVFYESDWYLEGIGKRSIVFGISKESGLVMQIPQISIDENWNWYKNNAGYTNPGRGGEPSLLTKRDVDRQINIIKDSLDHFPVSVFQVGCSDGYTLNSFRQAGAQKVTGVDPSSDAHRLAKRKYNIDYYNTTVEKLDIKEKFDLIILTHVLEHLYNPKDTLEKCWKMQNENGLLLIEVPLLDNIESCSPVYFSFEHINYFSEKTLIWTLEICGYKPFVITKIMDRNSYPVITIVAKRSYGINLDIERKNDYQQTKLFVDNVLHVINNRWEKSKEIIIREVQKDIPLFIYGFGTHSTQLFDTFPELKNYNIHGFIDSDKNKWNKKLLGYQCFSPKTYKFPHKCQILISSFDCEEEIYSFLKENYFSEYDFKIIRLYHND